MFSRRVQIATLLGALFGVGAVASFGPLVRHQVGEAAARYGATVEIEHVVPTLGGVRLEGLEVTFDEIPSAKLHVDEAEVSYGLHGRKVAFRGGAVSAVGPRETVMKQVEAWRSHHASQEPSGSSSSGAGNGTDIDGVALRWQSSVNDPAEAVTATGLHVKRAEGKVTLSADEASVALSGNTVEVKNGRVELVKAQAGGYRLGSVDADAVEAQVSLPSGKAKPSGSAPTDLVPSDDAAPGDRGIAALRASLVKAARLADGFLEPGAGIHLKGLHARLRKGGDSLNLGPGAFSVSRVATSLVVELSPELRGASPAPGPAPAGSAAAPANAAPAKEEALTFRLAIPLGDTGPQEVVADVKGGPIWLSSLGIREGDFGLFDLGHSSLTTRSHVELSADGKSVRVDGEGKIHGLSLKSAALSDEPVAGLELAFRVKGEADVDLAAVKITDGEVDLGSIQLSLQGTYERAREAHRIHGTFNLPITACQSMLDSAPKGLVPKLSGMRMAGSFALKGRADIDTAHLDKAFHLDWDISNTCRITEASPDVRVDRFKHAFKRTAYDAEGRPVTLETGPGTADWVSYGSISKFMETAVMVTEDAGFLRHHGFDQEAIKNSIRENLKQHRFVRGASTVSMQLAKNLYLERGKTLSRKLQEAVLTMYLEQELTKEQIIELYLNVVELGPMVYGVGPASRAYFNTSAADLSFGQALYLSSVLPNPKVQHFGAGGAVSEGWMNMLRRLMKHAHMRNRITDAEYDEAIRETVVRGSPSPHRAAKAFVPGDAEPGPEAPVNEEWTSP